MLAEAERVVNGDRKQTYGDALRSFTRIADLWTPVLGVPVTAHQVALCLVQLKVSRAVGRPDHADSYVDMAGYTALAAELAGVVLPKGEQ